MFISLQQVVLVSHEYAFVGNLVKSHSESALRARELPNIIFLRIRDSALWSPLLCASSAYVITAWHLIKQMKNCNFHSFITL